MSLLELKDKVQRWMTDAGLRGIEITPNGGYTFRFESTQVFIEFEQRGEGEHAFTAVVITAPFLQSVKATPELYEWVARSTDNWLFGHLGMVVDEETGDAIVALTHTLLGDYLDPPEFHRALAAVASTANNIDDDIAARFGGETFHSD